MLQATLGVSAIGKEYPIDILVRVLENLQNFLHSSRYRVADY